MFRNAPQISLHRLPAQRRRFLLFIRTGGGAISPLPPGRLAAPRAFDLALSYYAPPAASDPLLAQAEIVLGGGLSKFHAAKCLLAACAFAQDYEAAMFLDEDVELRFDPDAFFGFCAKNDLALAQPSLSADSSCNFSLLRHNPSFVYRTINFVEVMAPRFSRDFLRQAWPSFDHSLSTWGLDLLWAAQLGPQRRAAVVDQFQMHHAKPMQLGGAFYRYLDSIGVDCFADLRRVMDELGIEQHEIRQHNAFTYAEAIRRPPPGVTLAAQIRHAGAR